jgi:hypothetical protein
MLRIANRFHPLALAGLLTLVLGLAAAGCATTKEVSLTWQPTTDVTTLQAKPNTVDLGGAKVQFAKLEDARKNPAQIGEQPGKEPKTVTTKDDVGQFVATNLAKSIAQMTPGSGLMVTNTDATTIVSGQVVEFYVTEQSDLKYDAVVRLHLQVKKADGTVLYDGTASGKSSRPGFPFKGENYLENLGNAVLQVASSLVEDRAFIKALKGG